MRRPTLRLALFLSALSLVTACHGASKQSSGALQPGSPALQQLYQEGRADYQSGKYNEAAAKFARVVEADPTNLNALMNWGVTLSRSGKPAEAIPKYQQVLARDPNNAEAYYNWGVALERLHKHQEALEKYEQAIALKHDLLTPALQGYLERHRPTAADKAIGTNPSQPPSQ